MADDEKTGDAKGGADEDKAGAEPYQSFATKDDYTEHFSQAIGRKTAGHKRKEAALQAEIDTLKSQIDASEDTDDKKSAHEKDTAKWERQRIELAEQKTAAEASAAEAREELQGYRMEKRARDLLTGAKVKSEYLNMATKHLLLEEGLFEVQQQEDGPDIVAVLDPKTGIPNAKPEEWIAQWVAGTPFGVQAPRGSPAPGAGHSSGNRSPGSRSWDQMTALEKSDHLASQGR